MATENTIKAKRKRDGVEVSMSRAAWDLVKQDQFEVIEGDVKTTTTAAAKKNDAAPADDKNTKK